MPLTGNLVTRFPNGVTNVAVGDIFNELKVPDPTLYHTYFNDFDHYDPDDWSLSEVESGAGDAAEALSGGNGGILLLTCDNADNDYITLQTQAAVFTCTYGKKQFMKCRFKLNEVLQSDFAIGLQGFTAPQNDATALTVALDGIFFLKADGAATVDVYYRKDNSTGSSKGTAVATLVNDTYIELAFFHDGVDRLYYAVDGAVLGYIDASTTYMPNVDLAPTIALKQGEATNVKTAKIDYLFIAQER